MSKPAPQQGSKAKAAPAVAKKPLSAADAKKLRPEDDDALASARSQPPQPPPSPFDLLPSIFALPSLMEQRQRVASLLGLQSGPDGLLCFENAAVDEAALHLRQACCELRLSSPQLAFFYQLLQWLYSQLLLPDPAFSLQRLTDRLRLLLTTNCVELLPGTSYVDTTHALPPLSLPPLPLPPSAPEPAEPPPDSSRPSTSAAKKAAALQPSKPKPAPSPRPAASSSVSKAGKGAKAAAEEPPEEKKEETAEAPPALPPAPPAHFLSGSQSAAVYRHLEQRLLRHAELYRSVWRREQRERAEARADWAEFVWRMRKEQRDARWLLPLSEATESDWKPDEQRQQEDGSQQQLLRQEEERKEQQRQEEQTAVAAAAAIELSWPPGEYSAEELAHLTALKAELEAKLARARQEAVGVRKMKQEEQKEAVTDLAVSLISAV